MVEITLHESLIQSLIREKLARAKIQIMEECKDRAAVVERCFSKLESEIGDIISHIIEMKVPCVQGTSSSIDPMIEELRRVQFG
jgi:hypothetical protein